MPATFSQVLTLCQGGYPIRRASWPNGAAVHFVRGKVPQDVSDEVIGGVPRHLFDVEGSETLTPGLQRIGGFVHDDLSWTPETDDLLASDWSADDQNLTEDPTVVRWPDQSTGPSE